MTDEQDYREGDITAGGSRIIEGKERPDDWQPPESYAENCELIEDHLKPVFGENASVFHEIISDIVHLDVLAFPPNAERDFWVYVTSGMGDLRMEVPDGLDAAEWGRGELIIALPRAWGDRIAEDDALEGEDPEAAFWPISLMKWLARYPHQAATWFTDGHTIPSLDGGAYAPDTRLSGAMFVFSSLLPDAFQRLQLPDGDWLNFYGLVLLYPEEMDFKLSKGFDPLLKRLGAAGVFELVDIHRQSVVRKNPLLRLLGMA